MARNDIGLVGTGVMGRNLALNIADRGYTVAVYDLDVARARAFVAESQSENVRSAVDSPAALCGALKTPRRILMMVPAGSPVDQTIEALLPALEPGDILIDGGNSHYTDTNRRVRLLEEKGFAFVGAGVSGGAEGARHGPSIMPGGSVAAWEHVKPILQAIAARADDGGICCDWVGEGGAGHFVKMVHNGIEYGDMQLICEAYDLLRQALGLALDGLADVFAEWNEGDLRSYLIEITSDILRYRLPDGTTLVDKVLDSAGQKGTGKWTAVNALELGQPATLIGSAVFARFLSALKDERRYAAEVLSGPRGTYDGDARGLIRATRDALLAAKLVCTAQGFQLLRAAAGEYNWNIPYAGVAGLWRAGCIIRSASLDRVRAAFDRDPQLENLLLDEYFAGVLARSQAGWRQVVATGATLGVPLPAMSAALAYYDGYRRARLPANLLQAQRDFFGSHTYERTDRPRGQFFHADWTGDGGEHEMTGS
jgi:6-phosphogluconate dehydrogenase